MGANTCKTKLSDKGLHPEYISNSKKLNDNKTIYNQSRVVINKGPEQIVLSRRNRSGQEIREIMKKNPSGKYKVKSQ